MIIANIATESSGKADAARREPGYVSDREAPHYGLMQTLISTARAAIGDSSIDRDYLLDPDGSIRAGTAYIAQQSKKTQFDPPVVACAYNAGSVVRNDSSKNRWRMRQFPIGTSAHADRWVSYFNDCHKVLAAQPSRGAQRVRDAGLADLLSNRGWRAPCRPPRDADIRVSTPRESGVPNRQRTCRLSTPSLTK